MRPVTLRLALLSDIHGNLVALDAVLADVAARGGVDAWVILGDLVAIGPQPVEVLDRLGDLANAVFLRGNTDRYVVTGDRPEPTFEEAAADPQARERFIQCANSFSWTQGAVAASGWLDWLAGLELEHRFELPDGSTALCVHASPGTDDGPGIHECSDAARVRAVASAADARYLFVGHTHSAVDYPLPGTHIWNLGCVSNPIPPDLRASYLLVEASQLDSRVTRHRVAYDLQRVLEITRKRRHPAEAHIRQFYLGERVPGWRRGAAQLPGPRGLEPGSAGAGTAAVASLSVRDLVLSDADAAAGLVCQLGYPVTGAAMRDRLRSILPSRSDVTLVAEAAGRPVGLVGARLGRGLESNAPYARLTGLVVDEGWRGQGIGRRLMEEIERRMRGLGASVLILTSGAHRHESHAFYARIGYTETGKRFAKPL